MDEHEDLEHAAMVDENRSRITSISPERARFPCCIVWTPLPVLSWFIPFIGHLGICREDGVILDFAGPNFVCVDNFTFGSPARYIQLKKEQCDNLQDSSFNGNEDDEYEHTEPRTNTLTWDEALHKSTQEYQHHSYNLLTCNCHSFVGNVLNRLRFQGRRWNVINLAAFVFLNGRWVSKSSFLKSFVPFLVVFGLGVLFGGGTFLVYLLFLVFVLVCWFFVGTYCFKIVYV